MIANAVPIVHTQNFNIKQTDATLWPWFLYSQVIQTTSILAGSIPYLRQFLEALPSGMLKSSDICRRGLTYHEFSTEAMTDEYSQNFSLKKVNSKLPNPQVTATSSGRPYQPSDSTSRDPFSEINALSLPEASSGFDGTHCCQDEELAIMSKSPSKSQASLDRSQAKTAAQYSVDLVTFYPTKANIGSSFENSFHYPTAPRIGLTKIRIAIRR